MTDKDNGGYVNVTRTGKFVPNPNWQESFPDNPYNAEMIPEFIHGITRRDWLAGLAMQGNLASWPDSSPLSPAIESIAEISYQLADAMIEESKK